MSSLSRKSDQLTLLIDSHYLGFQALYCRGLGGLSHSDVATGVLFGFLGRILHLGGFFQTNDIVFCWDSPKSYRKRKFSWYKEHRQAKTAEEQAKLNNLYIQLNLLRDTILPRIGFANQIIQTGCECDDLIAKIVEKAESDYVIISADEDLFQLLRGNVRMYNPSKHKMMTAGRFEENFGLPPWRWAEVKSIAGCPTDRVPGVGGVGTPTAIQFLKGELKEGKKKDSIMKGILNGTVERNGLLVTLPISRTRHIITVPNVFSIQAFTDVCKEYGLTSFLQKGRLSEWESLFKGTITEEPGMLYGKAKRSVRPPRRKRENNLSTEQ